MCVCVRERERERERKSERINASVANYKVVDSQTEFQD